MSEASVIDEMPLYLISVAGVRKSMISNKATWNDKNFITTHLSQEKPVWIVVARRNHVLNQSTAEDMEVSIYWKTFT